MEKDIILIESYAFEINGVKYKEKEQARGRGSRRLNMLLAMGFMFGLNQGNVKRKSIGHEVNIIEEYALIQEKKSNLTKSNRDLVVGEFENRFEILL